MKKLNVADKIILKRNYSAFALDNDGFRYALATAMGAVLESFQSDAEKIWKISSTAVIEIVGRIKEMEAFTTVSILNLNESYQAVSKMCKVNIHENIRVEIFLYFIFINFGFQGFV